MSVKFDFILVPRSQFFDFLRETSYKHALEHLEAAGPEKKWVICFSSYSKCLSIIDRFEGLCAPFYIRCAHWPRHRYIVICPQT